MRKTLICLFAVCCLLSALGLLAQTDNTAAYHETIVAAADGKPSLQLTNDSASPIVAFFRVDFSSGLEGRTYYDVYVGPRDSPIQPGASVTLGLGTRVNDPQNQIRAVVFEDGSSAGDPAWINAIFAMRLRKYDRLVAVRHLLTQQVGTGISREGIVRLLQSAKTDLDKQVPSDERRVMDDVVYQSAISTIGVNRDTPVASVLNEYLKHLEQQIGRLEGSQPPLSVIRARIENRPNPDEPIIPLPRSR